MVYGGALAAGAFAGQDVMLFGQTIDEGLPAYVAIALAARSATRSARSEGGRSVCTADGRTSSGTAAGSIEQGEAGSRGAVVRALGGLGRVPRPPDPGHTFVRIRSGGVFEVPFVRYTVLTLLGSAIWCFGFAGAGYAAGDAGRTSITRSATPRRSSRSWSSRCSVACLQVRQESQTAARRGSSASDNEESASPELHSPA